MPNYRRGRINEEMSRELASILREIKDPRVSENFISITNVDVTPDLKYAKIGFSSMTGDKAEIKKGLVRIHQKETGGDAQSAHHAGAFVRSGRLDRVRRAHKLSVQKDRDRSEAGRRKGREER